MAGHYENGVWIEDDIQQNLDTKGASASPLSPGTKAPAQNQPPAPAAPGAPIGPGSSATFAAAVKAGAPIKDEIVGQSLVGPPPAPVPTETEFRAARTEKIQSATQAAQSAVVTSAPDSKVKISPTGETSVEKPRTFVKEYDRWTSERAAERVLEKSYGTFQARDMSAVLTKYAEDGLITPEYTQVLSALREGAIPKNATVPKGYKDAGKDSGIPGTPSTVQRDALAVADSLQAAMKTQMIDIADRLEKGLSGKTYADAKSLNEAAVKIDPNAIYVLGAMKDQNDFIKTSTGKDAQNWYSGLIDPINKEQQKVAEQTPRIYNQLLAMGDSPEHARAVSEDPKSALRANVIEALTESDKTGKPPDLPKIAGNNFVNRSAWDDTKKPNSDQSSLGSSYADSVPRSIFEAASSTKEGTYQERAIAAVNDYQQKSGKMFSPLTADQMVKATADALGEKQTVEERAAKWATDRQQASRLAVVTGNSTKLAYDDPSVMASVYGSADTNGDNSVSLQEFMASYIGKVGGDQEFASTLSRAITDPASAPKDVAAVALALRDQYGKTASDLAKTYTTEALKSSTGTFGAFKEGGSRPVVTRTGDATVDAANMSAAITAAKSSAQDWVSAKAGGKEQTILLSRGTGTALTDDKKWVETRNFVASALSSTDKAIQDILEPLISSPSSTLSFVGKYNANMSVPVFDAQKINDALRGAGVVRVPSLGEFRGVDKKVVDIAPFIKNEDAIAAIKSPQVVLNPGDGFINGGAQSDWISRILPASDKTVTEDQRQERVRALSEAGRRWVLYDATATTTSKDKKVTTVEKLSGDVVSFLATVKHPALESLSTENGASLFTAISRDPSLDGPLMLKLFDTKTTAGTDAGIVLLIEGMQTILHRRAESGVAGYARSLGLSQDQIKGQPDIVGKLTTDDVSVQIKKMSEAYSVSEVNAIYNETTSRLTALKTTLNASIADMESRGIEVKKGLRSALGSVEYALERMKNSNDRSVNSLSITPFQRYKEEAMNLGVGETVASQIATQKVSEDDAAKLRAGRILKKNTNARTDGVRG